MKKIIIIGCGFSGMAAAEKLSRFKKAAQVTVIDKKTSFEFLPMLPDIIGRGIKPDLLSYPIRDLSKRLGFEFINEEVVAMDLEKYEVVTPVRKLTYDYLIIACGSETNFFGFAGAKKYAYKLDDTTDAQKILAALEEGQFDNYLISGGGYTGIEIATNLKVYLNKKSKNRRVIIVEKSPSILGPLPDWMKRYVFSNLKKLEIEVLANTVIESIEGERVSLSRSRTLGKTMLIWATGVKIPDFIQSIKAEKTPQGRLKVDAYLRLNQNCFVAGDAANFAYQDRSLRMAVQFSIMQGVSAADNIINSINQRELKKYKPQDFGYLIPLANNQSCGNVFGLNLNGLLAIVLHYLICIYRVCGWKKKLGIMRNLSKEVFHMLEWASFPLRMALGVIFVAHGLQKGMGFFSGPGIKGFAAMLAGLGFFPAIFWAYLVVAVELLGGIFLILGIFTRLSASLLFILIFVATLKVHLAKGFFASGGGYEYNLLILCACIALMILGRGKGSIAKNF